jgi:hypothetical protein
MTATRMSKATTTKEATIPPAILAIELPALADSVCTGPSINAHMFSFDEYTDESNNSKALAAHIPSMLVSFSATLVTSTGFTGDAIASTASSALIWVTPQNGTPPLIVNSTTISAAIAAFIVSSDEHRYTWYNRDGAHTADTVEFVSTSNLCPAASD